MPNTLYPLHYKLWIHPILDDYGEKNFTFTGRVTILINCLEDTNKIILNWDELNITDSDVEIYATKEVNVSPQPLRIDTTDDQRDIKRDVEEMGEGNNETTPMYVTEDDSLSATTEETTTVMDITDPTMQISEATSESSVVKSESTPWPVKTISKDEENLKLIITTKQNLQQGENYTVDIKFSGDILNNLVGLYRTHYVDLAGNIK